MSNRVLHKQLASIMEVLANSAVAEICKVVDDGYAVLRLEISQSKKENDALRRKLQVMERRLLHGRPEKTKMRESPVHPRSDGPHLYSEMKGTTVLEESYFSLDQQMVDIPRRAGKANALAEKSSSVHLIGDQCADVEEGRTELVLIKEETLEEDPQGEMKNEEQKESYFSLDQQMADIPRRARKANALAEKGSPVHLIGDQCADVEEGRTELVLIKEETVEEDPQGEMKNEEQRAVEWRAGSREKRPVEETQNKAANHTEELTEQHRTRRAVWEVSGLESVLKAEGQSECVETLQHRGTEHRAGGLNSLDSEFVRFEGPGQLGSYCTQGGAVTETEDPCCSYSTETDSESLAFRSELQFTASKDDGGHASLSAGSRDVNPDAPMQPVSVKIEAGLQPAWSRRPVSELVYSEQRHGPVERGRQAALPHNVFSLRLPHNISVTTGTTATAPQSNPDDVNGTPLYEKRCTASKGFRGHRKVCTRKRKFICKYCGKGFPRAKELEIHQRVHTGEKPFGCTHCGKRFTQKCNLKTHLSIHTGEKPFRCLQCGKGFVQSGYLKAHQRVHTGEKPFSCAKCGKRFGQSSYLRSHQSVHTGEKPFSCAHCGKGFTRSCHLKRHQTVHEPGNCADVDLF